MSGGKFLVRLDARRELLAERLELIQEAEARGDGGSAWIELELLLDEMRFLRDLYRERLPSAKEATSQ